MYPQKHTHTDKNTLKLLQPPKNPTKLMFFLTFPHLCRTSHIINLLYNAKNTLFFSNPSNPFTLFKFNPIIIFNPIINNLLLEKPVNYDIISKVLANKGKH